MSDGRESYRTVVVIDEPMVGLPVTPERPAVIARQGWTWLRWQHRPGEPTRFSWVCPDCGIASGGHLGEEPISGWDGPQWVLSGSEQQPTLAPSLGCPGFRAGTCPGGHYWLRNGELVRA